MKIGKILALSFMFLTVSIFAVGIPSKAIAEENEMVAQVKAKPVSPSRPQVDCRYVEGKDKDGNKIYTLEGKGCEEAVAKMEQVAQQDKTLKGTCCVCEMDRGLRVCRGQCCFGLLTKVGVPMAVSR